MPRKLTALIIPTVFAIACGSETPVAPTPSGTVSAPAANASDDGAVGILAADCAAFVSENYPDYTYVKKNTTILKTWRIRNCGSKTWTTSYKLWKVSGNTCGGSSSGNLTSSVPPNGIANLWAYCNIGTAAQYQATFTMRNASGQSFPSSFWVIVNTY